MKIPSHKIENSQIIDRINTLLKENNLDLNLLPSNVVFFPSKKHYVMKITSHHSTLSELKSYSQFLIKFFNPKIPNSELRWTNEIQIYQKFSQRKEFQQFNFPRLLKVLPKMLVLEYIPGSNLQEILLAKNMNEGILLQLSHWYATLHKFSLTFGDNRLSNFVVDDSGQLFIIDVEEISQNTDFIEEIASLLSSFIDLSPGIFEKQVDSYNFTQMEKFLKNYIQASIDILPYSASYGNRTNSNRFWTDEIMKALSKIAARRHILFNEIEKLWVYREIGSFFDQNMFK